MSSRRDSWTTIVSSNRRALIVTAIVTCVTLEAKATLLQRPQPHAPSFEVASIKLSSSKETGRISQKPGGLFDVTNMPLVNLVMFALRVKDFQIVDVPDWVRKERYDISARASIQEPDKSSDYKSFEYPRRLLSLLQDRFAFTTHVEMREMPVYKLTLVKDRSAIGARLKPSNVDCSLPGERIVTPVGSGVARPRCGVRTGPGMLAASAVPLAELIATLQTVTHQLVIDSTGLLGRFDIDLEWADDNGLSVDQPPTPLSSGPSLFTAIQEQLGLKLVASKAQAEIVVIDQIQRPSPN